VAGVPALGECRGAGAEVGVRGARAGALAHRGDAETRRFAELKQSQNLRARRGRRSVRLALGGTGAGERTCELTAETRRRGGSRS